MANIIVPVSVGSISLHLTQSLEQVPFHLQKPAYPSVMNGTLELGMPEMSAGSVLHLPSPWTRTELKLMFAEANKLWTREAGIEFKVTSFQEKTVIVYRDDLYFDKYIIDSMNDAKQGVRCGFVHSIDAETGGWAVPKAEGGFTCLSFQARSLGTQAYGGLLLAHELGHVLTKDLNHLLANGDVHNIMYANHSPHGVRKGVLTADQKAIAVARAQELA